MEIDDLFIRNDSSAVEVLTAVTDVDANNEYCAALLDWTAFRDDVTGQHKYGHYIEVSVKYDPRRISLDKIHEVEERVLYIRDALSVAASPVLFRLTRQPANLDAPSNISRSRNELTDNIFSEYERFEMCMFIDYSSSVFAVVGVIARMNQCLEAVREKTYNSSSCRLGMYFKESRNYRYLVTKGVEYAFDWCSFQNELFKNSEVMNILRKTQKLTMMMLFLEIFPKEKEQYLRLRIYDYISRYSRRKLMKL